METEATRHREHPKKTWWDYVRGDIPGMAHEDVQDKDQWKVEIS